MPDIDDVRQFWNSNPLWVGDAQSRGVEPGSKAWFDAHTRAYLTEIGGALDQRFVPVCPRDAPILDLGCGIGFWPEQLGRLGFTNITAADISRRSLELTQKRCAFNDIRVTISEQNAEATTFADNTFDHVHSIGVIHHSPNPQASLDEMHRILRPGGRAVVAVYYRNLPLRHWRAFRSLAILAARVGFTPKGRGRDDMMVQAKDANDLVRLYDGRDNPVGLAFSRSEYRAMLSRFRVIDLFAYAFPARSLPVKVPRPAFRVLERMCPFLICAVLQKP